MTSNPANTAAEPRTALLITLAAEILRFTGGCEKPHRNGEANPHVHLEVTHRWGQRLAAIARADAAQDRPAEPGLREAQIAEAQASEWKVGFDAGWQKGWFAALDAADAALAASPPPAPEAGLTCIECGGTGAVYVDEPEHDVCQSCNGSGLTPAPADPTDE